MNCQEHIIKGMKVQVFDDVMPAHVVTKWMNFYEYHASFRMMSAENGNKEDTPYWFSMPVDVKTRYQVFEIEKWLMPRVTEYNPQCLEKDFMRSYVNLCTCGDGANGHVDTSAKLENKGEFFIATLLFLNPYVKDPADAGFEFEGDVYVENKFNRLIIFDGRLWHKAHVPTDNLVRLTFYNSFKHPREVHDYTKAKSMWLK